MTKPELQAMPYTMVEMHQDLDHYLGDLDPQRVLATIIALERAENAAHYAEKEAEERKTREQMYRKTLERVLEVLASSRKAASKGGGEYGVEFIRTLILPVVEETLESP